MIHTHSLDRAARYYPERVALASNGKSSTFRELHDRVGRIAAALSRRGFRVGDRLALLLPNEPEYIELVYACAWLGVIVVPLNTRLSIVEIDRILADSGPHGLIRRFPGSEYSTRSRSTFLAIPVRKRFTTRARYWLSSTPVEQPATPKALS